MNLRRQHSRAIAVTLPLALSACGKSPEQHLQQARGRLQKAGYKAAVIELKTVLQEQPDNRAAHLLLAEVFLRSGAYPDVEQEQEWARSLGAPDEQVLPPLAKAYLRMGNPAAIDLLSAAHSASWAAEGDAALAKKQYPAALAAYERTHKLAPSPATLVGQHQALALSGRFEEGAKRLADWLAAHPQDRRTRLYLAGQLIAHGQSKAAADHYLLLNQLAPGNVVVLNKPRLGAIGLGDKRALGFAEQALKLKPDNPAIMGTLGWILVQQGQTERGTRLLQQALSGMPNAAEIR